MNGKKFWKIYMQGPPKAIVQTPPPMQIAMPQCKVTLRLETQIQHSTQKRSGKQMATLCPSDFHSTICFHPDCGSLHGIYYAMFSCKK